jgi:protein TonB
MSTSFSDRAISAIGAALVTAMLGYALLIGLTVAAPTIENTPLAVLNIPAPRPQAPPVKPPHPRDTRSRPAGLERMRGGATVAVVPRPEPVIPMPSILPSPPETAIVLAPVPGNGGRSGTGNGTGSAGNGGGSGGDGDGDGTPPRQTHGHLAFEDLPEPLRAAILARGTGGTVTVAYEIEVDGRVSGCIPVRSSGEPELDRETCRLIEQHFRFAPARDGNGRAVRSRYDDDEHDWDIAKLPADDQRPDKTSRR